MDPTIINLLFKSAAVCVPLYYLFWKFLFRSWDDFLDDLKYYYQPFWLSALRGEFGDDFYASLKLYFFLLLCGGSTFLVYRKFFAPIDP
jgi:hypothetical protein